MPPKFSLQNVLDVRHGKVELLEIELGKFLAFYRESEELYLSLQAEHGGLLELLNAAQSAEFDLFKISVIRSNILYLNNGIESLALELARQKQKIMEKRDELVKAKQDEETLEILKKKRHELYLAEQVLTEMRTQDDIYIARAFQNQQQGA